MTSARARALGLNWCADETCGQHAHRKRKAKRLEALSPGKDAWTHARPAPHRRLVRAYPATHVRVALKRVIRSGHPMGTKAAPVS